MNKVGGRNEVGSGGDSALPDNTSVRLIPGLFVLPAAGCLLINSRERCRIKSPWQAQKAVHPLGSQPLK